MLNNYDVDLQQPFFQITLFPSCLYLEGYCQFRMRDLNPGIQKAQSVKPRQRFLLSIAKTYSMVRDQAITNGQRLAVRAKRVRSV